MNINILHAENRIARLKIRPVENAKLIKKWERILRNLQNNT